MLHGEIVCCICRGASSRDNNEIVLCDKCGAGKTMVLLFYPTFAFIFICEVSKGTGIFRWAKNRKLFPVIK